VRREEGKGERGRVGKSERGKRSMIENRLEGENLTQGAAESDLLNESQWPDKGAGDRDAADRDADRGTKSTAKDASGEETSPAQAATRAEGRGGRGAPRGGEEAALPEGSVKNGPGGLGSDDRPVYGGPVEEDKVHGRPLEEGAIEEGPEEDDEKAEERLVPLEGGELKLALEAVLFALAEPINIRSLSEILGASVHDVREAVEELRFEYMDTGRAFRLEDIAGGVQILTLKTYDPWIRKLRTKQREGRLSPAALETLAVIAYKQPINKADLEAIRGVNCTPILKTLLDRGLVHVVGRGEGLGRPLLYGTTRRFLESFGIATIRDLPQPESDVQVGAEGEPAKGLFSAGAGARPGVAGTPGIVEPEAPVEENGEEAAGDMTLAAEEAAARLREGARAVEGEAGDAKGPPEGVAQDEEDEPADEPEKA